MDQGTLVENQIDDGLGLVKQLMTTGFNVAAAFWVRTSEDGQWTLYIASKAFDESGPAVAYRKVADALGSLQDPWVSMSEIKMIGEHNPIVEDVIEILKRYPGRMPTRSRRPHLGNMAIDEVYIYPLSSLSPPVYKVEKRRLKKDVKQIERPEDFLLTQEDRAAIAQLTAQGVNHDEAERWVRKKRGGPSPRPPIPAGAIVQAWIAAHWGDSPANDPNPLLMVETEDKARGLVLMEDTESAP